MGVTHSSMDHPSYREVEAIKKDAERILNDRIGGALGGHRFERGSLDERGNLVFLGRNLLKGKLPQGKKADITIPAEHLGLFIKTLRSMGADKIKERKDLAARNADIKDEPKIVEAFIKEVSQFEPPAKTVPPHIRPLPLRPPPTKATNN